MPDIEVPNAHKPHAYFKQELEKILPRKVPGGDKLFEIDDLEKMLTVEAFRPYHTELAVRLAKENLAICVFKELKRFDQLDHDVFAQALLETNQETMLAGWLHVLKDISVDVARALIEKEKRQEVAMSEQSFRTKDRKKIDKLLRETGRTGFVKGVVRRRNQSLSEDDE